MTASESADPLPIPQKLQGIAYLRTPSSPIFVRKFTTVTITTAVNATAGTLSDGVSGSMRDSMGPH